MMMLNNSSHSPHWATAHTTHNIVPRCRHSAANKRSPGLLLVGVAILASPLGVLLHDLQRPRAVDLLAAAREYK